MAFYQFRRQQFLPAPAEAVWDFISSPGNLKTITPAYMGFVIHEEQMPPKMYPGMIITYTVSPLLGIRLRWITEITHVDPLRYFVDEQRSGPYAMWHHQHILKPAEGGVIMTDIVSYKPPMGLLGAIANRLVIARKLREIFDFRQKVLEDIFDSPGFQRAPHRG